MTDTIKPCPFCGGAAEFEYDDNDEGCGAQSQHTDYDNAVERWNRRAGEDAERQRVARLLDGIDKDECEDDSGWWETDAGASFGARVLKAVMDGSDEVPPAP